MDPQGGEGNKNQSPVATLTAVVDRPLNATVEPNVGSSSNPLDKLEGVVAAAQLEAAAQAAPAPVQAPVGSPQREFENQFGSGPATPPVAESAPGLIDTALASLGTTQADIQPAPEAPPVPQPEEKQSDPQQEFKDEVAQAADKLLKALEEKKI